MGFDLTGLSPDAEVGEYFRNNVWWWRRLWDFACYVAGETYGGEDGLTDKDYKGGCFNDGHQITREKALTIARMLRRALKQKEVYEPWLEETENEYILGSIQCVLDVWADSPEEEIMKNVDKDLNDCSHPFSWENVEKFADFCEHSGGFEIW